MCISDSLATDPEFDGIICLPGTHTKWVRVSAGEVCHFATFMTGELFALLSSRSVLRHSIAAEGWEGDAFRAGLDETYARPQRLAGHLFGIRAAGLLGTPDHTAARAKLSGMLIGAEMAAAKPYWLGQRIAIIGNDQVAGLYGEALTTLGTPSENHDAPSVTLAGLTAAFQTLA